MNVVAKIINNTGIVIPIMIPVMLSPEVPKSAILNEIIKLHCVCFIRRKKILFLLSHLQNIPRITFCLYLLMHCDENISRFHRLYIYLGSPIMLEACSQ